MELNHCQAASTWGTSAKEFAYWSDMAARGRDAREADRLGRRRVFLAMEYKREIWRQRVDVAVKRILHCNYPHAEKDKILNS